MKRTFSTTFSEKETGMHLVLRQEEVCEDPESCEGLYAEKEKGKGERHKRRSILRDEAGELS